jgi:hypothetical protein
MRLSKNSSASQDKTAGWRIWTIHISQCTEVRNIRIAMTRPNYTFSPTAKLLCDPPERKAKEAGASQARRPTTWKGAGRRMDIFRRRVMELSFKQ